MRAPYQGIHSQTTSFVFKVFCKSDRLFHDSFCGLFSSSAHSLRPHQAMLLSRCWRTSCAACIQHPTWNWLIHRISARCQQGCKILETSKGLLRWVQHSWSIVHWRTLPSLLRFCCSMHLQDLSVLSSHRHDTHSSSPHACAYLRYAVPAQGRTRLHVRLASAALSRMIGAGR